MQAGNEWSKILPKSSQGRKKPPTLTPPGEMRRALLNSFLANGMNSQYALLHICRGSFLPHQLCHQTFPVFWCGSRRSWSQHYQSAVASPSTAKDTLDAHPPPVNQSINQFIRVSINSVTQWINKWINQWTDKSRSLCTVTCCFTT